MSKVYLGLQTMEASEVLLSNKGYIRMNGVELAELKNIEIKLVPNIAKKNGINSPSTFEIITSIEGVITFEIYKMYSRFKPEILKQMKNLNMFVFDLECVTYNKDYTKEEALNINSCWMNGEIVLARLNADAEILTEKYQAGFMVELAQFLDYGIIDDGLDW